MKEKLFKKGIKRRLFSVVLAVALIFSLMPMNTITVLAEDLSETISCSDLTSKFSKKQGSFTLSGGEADAHGVWVGGVDGPLLITSDGIEKITKVELTIGFNEEYTNYLRVNHGSMSGNRSESKSVTISGVNNTSLEISTSSEQIQIKQMKIYYTPLHAHDWRYTADEATLNAYCAQTVRADNCDYQGSSSDLTKAVSLTLTASSPNYSGIEGLNAFNEATGKNVQESDVKFYTVTTEGATTDGTGETSTPPTADGYYYASLTVGGQTAVKAFTIGTPGAGSGITWGDIKSTIELPAGVSLPTVDDATPVIEVTGSTTTLSAGWYVVNSEIGSGTETITVSGDVDLLLADGSNLNVMNIIGTGILTIWGQNGGTGKLTVTNSGSGAIDLTGSITVNGGTVEASGSTGISVSNGITVNGGMISATGDGNGCSGIYTNNGITITGGIVTATGNHEQACGILANGGNVTINGGTVTATSINNGGIKTMNGSVIISGGNVRASGGTGINVNNKNVTVSGGTVYISGASYGFYSTGTVAVNGGDTLEVTAGIKFFNGSGSLSIVEPYKVVAGNTKDSATVPTFNVNWKTTLADKKYVNIHKHNFTYSASGTTLIATCSSENCFLPENKVSLTLTATSPNYSGSAVEAKYGDGEAEAWKSVFGTDAPTIEYEAKEGSELTAGKAIEVGHYTAKITVEDKIASVDFEIRALAPKFDSCGGSEVTLNADKTGPSANPIWKSYTFDGWYTSALGGNKVTSFTGGETYYAHWKSGEKTVVSQLLDFTKEDAPTSGPGFIWNKETNTLTLTNFLQDCSSNITNTEYTLNAIKFPAKATVKLSGDNQIISPKADASNKSVEGIVMKSGVAGGIDFTTTNGTEATLKVDMATTPGSMTGIRTGGASTISKGAKITVNVAGDENTESVYGYSTGSGKLTIDKDSSLTVMSNAAGKISHRGVDVGPIDVAGTLRSELQKNQSWTSTDLIGIYIHSDGSVIRSTGKVTGRVKVSSSTEISNRYDHYGVYILSGKMTLENGAYLEALGGRYGVYGSGTIDAPNSIIKGGLADGAASVKESYSGLNYVTFSSEPTVTYTPVSTLPTFTYGTASAEQQIGTVSISNFESGTASYSFKWYDASTGGNQITSGTPSASTKDNNKVVVSTTATTEAKTYYLEISATVGSDTAVSKRIAITINKGDYTGTKTASGELKAKNGESVTVTLPSLPDGASYGEASNSNEAYFTVGTVSDGKVTVTSVKDWDAETETESKTFTIPVTGADNYNDYEVTVTITPTFHMHQFRFEVLTGDNNILVATCDAEGCELTDHKVALTLFTVSPTYTGEPVEPTITYGTFDEQAAWTGAGLALPGSTGEGAPTVTKTYYSTDESGEKSGEGSATAPTAVGTYVVEIKISYGEGKEATVLLAYNVNKTAGAEASAEGTTVAGGQKTVTISGMKEGQEYIVSTEADVSALTDADWSTPVGADGIAADLADETTYYVYTRVKETDNSNAGDAVLVDSASTNVAVPTDNKTGYTVSDDKITVADGYEVFADENCTEPVVTGTTLIPGTTYYVRKAGKEGFRPSEALSFTYYNIVDPRTVTYDLNKGTGTQPAPQTVENGSLIDAPVFAEGLPVKGSLSFQGWYKDRACTEAWDFAKDQLTEDITLYAGYAYDAGNNEEKAEMSVLEVEDCIYNGKAHKPVVIVKHDGKVLTLNKDYTVSYKNNTNANPVDEDGNLITGGIDDKFKENLPTIIIKGKGNYKSEVKLNFNIIPYSLDEDDIAYNVTDYIKAKPKSATAVKVSLSAGSKKLKAGRDYVAVLVNEANPKATYTGLKVPKGESGVYSLTITGKGNYTGTLYSVITIAGAGDILEMNKAKIKMDKIAYEGKAITAEDIKGKIKSVKIGNTTLTADDYDVTLNVDSISSEGRYVVAIEGKNQDKVIGSKTIVVTVSGTAISKAKVSFNEANFDNSNHGRNGMKVEIKSGDTTKTLAEGTDYIVKSIKNDLKAGKATVEIQGIGIYKGTKRSTYKINQRVLSDKESDGFIIAPIENQKYQKSGAMPDVEIKYQGVKLTKGTDYTLSYKDNKKTGTGCVTVTGKGNYKGQIKDLKYAIVAASFEESGVTVQAKDVVYNTKKPAKYQSVPVVYDGNGKKLTANKDYSKTVKYYSYDGEFDGDYSSSALEAHKGAPLESGSEPEARSRIIVEVSPIEGGNYTGSVYGTYRVTANSISKAKITFKDQMYTGNKIELSASDVKEAKINKTTTLEYGKDFEIVEGSYVNNIKKGTAKVTVRGLGNYGGTKVVKFKITSKNIVWWNKK